MSKLLAVAAADDADIFREFTNRENSIMLGNLTAAGEMSGILFNIREMYGKISSLGKLSQNLTKNCINRLMPCQLSHAVYC